MTRRLRRPRVLAVRRYSRSIGQRPQRRGAASRDPRRRRAPAPTKPACVPSAGPGASGQPIPRPAAGKGALNLDLRTCGRDEEGRELLAFVFAPLARTIGASDHKEASCLRDRAKEFVCKKERRLAGANGYGWLLERQESSRRKRRMPIRKSFFRTGCRFRLSRPIRSPGCRRFRFRLGAGRCSADRPEASTPATAAATEAAVAAATPITR